MSDIEPGTVVADRYRLVRPIERGGMGAVWLAHHLQLDAPVAVKFMTVSVAEQPGMKARFEREAKAAAQIRSPYVVHIYDHGVDHGTPFIVMEFLEGEDLRRRIRGHRTLPPSEAVRLCDEVCKGLGRAHDLGIVHRDLKPGNIFLSAPDHMVKILDFGIAKETGKRRVVDGETTTTGQVLGSPHYMSPEQARGLPVDGRSDLWSLAVILYRAMTGERPFDGQDIGDLIVRICTDPVPKPSSLRPELGPTVDVFFERAFERDPERRFQTAAAFSEAFCDALGEHLLAERSGAWPARVSQGGLEPPASIPSGPLGTPTSSRFRALAMGELDDEEDVPTRTPGDTFAAATAAPRSSRRLVGRLVGGAVVLLVGGASAFIAFSGDDAPPETSVASESPPPTSAQSEPAPESTEAEPLSEDSEAKEEDDDAAAAASVSASAAAAAAPEPPPISRPVPPVRPRPVTKPKPKPEPKPKPKVDLGY